MRFLLIIERIRKVFHLTLILTEIGSVFKIIFVFFLHILHMRKEHFFFKR